MAKRDIDQVSPKTSEEALDFVRKMQKAFPKQPRTRKDEAALRKYLAQFTSAELRAVGRRLLSDLMQRPPRTIREGDLPPTPVAGPVSHSPAPPTSRPKPKAGPGRKRTTAVAKPRKARRRARRS
jgi:hypothetical protein